MQKNLHEHVKDAPPPSPYTSQQPSRMLLLILGYVAFAWGRAQGTPHRGTNSSQKWESGVNTSSLTDAPLHYINTQNRDRENPEVNKGGEGFGREEEKSSINSTNRTFSTLTDVTIFQEYALKCV